MTREGLANALALFRGLCVDGLAEGVGMTVSDLFAWKKPMFKADMVPVKVERHQRRKAREKSLEEAYEVVNQRDGNRCRVTGAHLEPGAVNPAQRREHHHLAGRRVEPSWREDPDRIILVSALAHDLITKGWIVIEGDHAGKAIRSHWASHVRPEMRPVHLLSRRRSQQ